MASQVSPCVHRLQGQDLQRKDARSLEAMEILRAPTFPLSIHSDSWNLGPSVHHSDRLSPGRSSPLGLFIIIIIITGESTHVSPGAGSVFFSHCISDT